MSTTLTWQEYHLHSEGNGITKELSNRVNALRDILAYAVDERAGGEILKLATDLIIDCKKAAASDDPSKYWQETSTRLSRTSLDDLSWILRIYTAYFRLVNQAEQHEIARINEARELKATLADPRKESVKQAVKTLLDRGVSTGDVKKLVASINIQPTLTAHPTEARRRSVLFKQKNIADSLVHLREEASRKDQCEAMGEIWKQVSLLLATDEVQFKRMKVADEVLHALYFVGTSIWEMLPSIYQDLDEALNNYYGLDLDLGPFLRYRSWVGGDRDGNPNVTAEVTKRTFNTIRRAAYELYHREVRELRRELSISIRHCDVDEAFIKEAKEEAQAYGLSESLMDKFKYEPFRMKLSVILDKLDRLREEEEGIHYSSDQFRSDLVSIRKALSSANLTGAADGSLLNKLIARSQAFGFFMTPLDVRQHSKVHAQAVTELFALAGITEDYTSLPEEDKLKILRTELRNARPLLPIGIRLSDKSQFVLEALYAIADIKAIEPEAIGTYIISMTHDLSDMLEVLVLLKETGLWRYTNGEVITDLDVSPLFETVEDLEHSEEFMAQIFEDEVYAAQLRTRGGFQEIMLGYSDSNKDGGYLMANWALNRGQDRLGKVCQKYGITMRLFHGRGGSTGRGGGRANLAIRSMPTTVQNGQIRFTEQGEIISFRYAIPEIASRHMEQIVNAVIVSTPSESGKRPENYQPDESVVSLFDEMSTKSMGLYRDLIDDPEFWPWYSSVTPIEHIGGLKIASRPISRKSGADLDFDGLRAIPWVFGWTQTRYNLPGWFGMGSSLSYGLEQEGGLSLLSQLYDKWPFFKTVIDNCQLEMSRTRLEIAELYTQFSDLNFHDRIVAEYEKAEKAILSITGQEELYESSKVIKKSIQLRNPYTDVLNLIQVELLKRWNESDGSDQEELGYNIFLSLNGVAAAMQSTG